MTNQRRPDQAGAIAVFPMANRNGQISQVAEVLMGKNGADADQYWREMLADMRCRLASTGLSDDIVRGELRSFAEAVLSYVDDTNTRQISARPA